MKNIVSGGMLRALVCGLELLRVPRIVELNTGREVLAGDYDEHGGMPWVALYDVLNLPIITSSCHHVMEENAKEDSKVSGRYLMSVFLGGKVPELSWLRGNGGARRMY